MTPEEEEKKKQMDDPFGSDAAPDSENGGPGDGWINLQDYFAVNQKQGENMARSLTADTKGKGDHVRSEIGYAQGQLGGQWNPQASDPTGAKANPSNPWAGYAMDTLRDFGNSKYQGPNSLNESYGGFGQEMADVRAGLGNTKNQYGLTQLGAGKGYSAWDLGAAANSGGQVFNDLQSQYGGLDKEFGLADEKYKHDVQAYKDRIAGAHAEYDDRLIHPEKQGDVGETGYVEGKLGTADKALLQKFEQGYQPGNDAPQEERAAYADWIAGKGKKASHHYDSNAHNWEDK